MSPHHEMGRGNTIIRRCFNGKVQPGIGKTIPVLSEMKTAESCPIVRRALAQYFPCMNWNGGIKGGRSPPRPEQSPSIEDAGEKRCWSLPPGFFPHVSSSELAPAPIPTTIAACQVDGNLPILRAPSVGERLNDRTMPAMVLMAIGSSVDTPSAVGENVERQRVRSDHLAKAATSQITRMGQIQWAPVNIAMVGASFRRYLKFVGLLRRASPPRHLPPFGRHCWC